MAKVERPLRATFHCRHYSYNPGDGPACAKGVALTLPGAARKCMPQQLVGMASALTEGEVCPLRAEFTKAERAVWDDWTKGSSNRMLAVLVLVPGSDKRSEDRKFWGTRGEVDCPNCNGGKVRWARAPSNGHIHAACSTENCVRFVQ